MRVESYGSARIFWPLYSREELIERLRAGIPALSKVLPLQKVVLFGSWAHGRATVRSDVDVLVVYAGEPRDDAYYLARTCLDTFGLEPHLYTEKQAAVLEKTLARMTEGAVVLYDETATASKKGG